MTLSHVAILVPSVQKAAEYLRQFKYDIGKLDQFEETREIYIEGGARNPLLLMEPKDTGSYREALKKRGPGPHHVAIDVLDLEKFVKSIAGSGWLLHPNSLQTAKDYRSVYLARPGFPALIEVQEKKEPFTDGPLFVEGLALKLEREQHALAQAVGLDQLFKPWTGRDTLSIQGRTIELADLY